MRLETQQLNDIGAAIIRTETQLRIARAGVDAIKSEINANDNARSKARKEAARTAELFLARSLADLIEAQYHLNRFRTL